MTMHKIWTKLCEKDWRTISKSLYILNCISRESSVDSCQRFAMAVRSMSRTRNPKNPDHRYFDIRLISNTDEPSEAYKGYINSYATYVLYRIKNFSSKFDELKEISESTHEKQVVARLKKAQQCISLALKCTTEKGQCNPITGQITKLIANDLKDLWKQFSLKIAPLVDQTTPYDQTAKAAEKDIASLLKFYSEAEKDIKTFLSKAVKSYQHLRLKFPSDIPSNSQIDATKLEARIAELVSITGGATNDDDDDDDEEEEDDDDSEGKDEEDDDQDDDSKENDEDDDQDDDSEEKDEDEDGDNDDDDDEESDRKSKKVTKVVADEDDEDDNDDIDNDDNDDDKVSSKNVDDDDNDDEDGDNDDDDDDVKGDSKGDDDKEDDENIDDNDDDNDDEDDEEDNDDEADNDDDDADDEE